MNTRKNKINQLMQKERESQFPVFYQNQGVCLYQDTLVAEREEVKYKVNDE